MHKPILSRYRRKADGQIIIDVAAHNVKEIYNDFDRSAHFMKKDLDEDFVSYLVDCAREIGSEPFVIQISLNELPEAANKERVKSSIANYFYYLIELERREIKSLFRTSAIFAAIGVTIMVLLLWTDRLVVPSGRSLFGSVLSEGLTVAAWVALWEAVAVFLIRWPPGRRNIRLYKKLAAAPVSFHHIKND